MCDKTTRMGDEFTLGNVDIQARLLTSIHHFLDVFSNSSLCDVIRIANLEGRARR